VEQLTEPKTNRLIDIINWGRELFLRRRLSHARYTIEVLLEHILGKKRAELYLDYDYRLSAHEMDLLRGYIVRRLDHWPLWHLVGTVEFYGLKMSVDSRVLIPRPETELVVECALRELAKNHPVRVRYVADIGTGSGNIAIAIARSRSDVFIYAVDISAEALEVADANTERHGVDGAISLLRGDLLEPFKSRGTCLDMIVSNPPYVAEGEWESLPPEVCAREPRLALYGGSDGLEKIRRIVADAPACLVRGGLLIMEVGHGHAVPVREMIVRSGEYSAVEIHKDYSDIERVVMARVK